MLLDLLLPTTDAGVLVQAAIAVCVFSVLLVATRRDPDLRLLMAGGAVLTAGLLLLRAAH